MNMTPEEFYQHQITEHKRWPKPEKPKLKPCPFCGHTAQYTELSKKFVVECQSCTVSTSVPMHSEKMAAEAWNKRA